MTPPDQNKKTSQDQKGLAEEDHPQWAPPESQPEPRPAEPVLRSQTRLLLLILLPKVLGCDIFGVVPHVPSLVFRKSQVGSFNNGENSSFDHTRRRRQSEIARRKFNAFFSNRFWLSLKRFIHVSCPAHPPSEAVTLAAALPRR